MNFRQVATEIMLHANEEKWYETRERIERALRKAAGQQTFREALDEYVTLRPSFSIDHWRDQPDGVR